MSQFELVTTYFSIGGLLALVCSLALLTWQIKQQTQASRSSAYSAVAAQTLQINQMYLQFPELRHYFYHGVPINETHPDYARVVTIADSILDFHESLLVQLPFNAGVRAGWEQYMIDAFAMSPVLCAYLDSVSRWYAPELARLKEAGEQRRLSGPAR